jgi:hypothetical protein
MVTVGKCNNENHILNINFNDKNINTGMCAKYSVRYVKYKPKRIQKSLQNNDINTEHQL